MLKNEGGILPLSMGANVAVIGDAGNKGAVFGGDGSGTDSPAYFVLIPRHSVCVCVCACVCVCVCVAGKVVPKNSSAVPLIDAMRARGIAASHSDGYDLSTAAALAKEADVAIVVLAQSSTEGHDRQYVLWPTRLFVVLHSAYSHSLQS